MKATPVYTLTGNLLWEQTLAFADWAPGRSQRATSATFQVGGKGVNVSKMLNRLGAPNTALCFTGGFSGAACAAWLKAGQFDFRAFPAAGATRAGTVIRGGLRRETTFLGPDASPGPAAVRACAAYLKARPDGGVLAICGSLPGWETADFDPLRAALERWMSRGTLVADTYGLDSLGRAEMIAVMSDSIAAGGTFVRRRVEAGDPNFVTMWNEMGGQERFDRRRRWWDEHHQEFFSALR